MGHIRIALWVSGSSGSTSVTHFQPWIAACLHASMKAIATLLTLKLPSYIVFAQLKMPYCMCCQNPVYTHMRSIAIIYYLATSYIAIK